MHCKGHGLGGEGHGLGVEGHGLGGEANVSVWLRLRLCGVTG